MFTSAPRREAAAASNDVLPEDTTGVGAVGAGSCAATGVAGFGGVGFSVFTEGATDFFAVVVAAEVVAACPVRSGKDRSGRTDVGTTDTVERPVEDAVRDARGTTDTSFDKERTKMQVSTAKVTPR
jgi:hypothetical protein